ncbi:MAG: endonuclease [Oscillospiraceae bacterium]|nr:endonuclease [Oscillospiraceae bacterium]
MNGEKTKKRKRSFWGRLLKAILSIVLTVVILAASLVGVLTATEFRPDAVESVGISGNASAAAENGATISVLTWNIGYGALGDNADFFMDGGKSVNTADRERIERNLNGMIERVEEIDPDIIFMQETDRNSARSKFVDEAARFCGELSGYESAFANNFKTVFVPYPLPPIGKVDGGILTLSKYDMSSAERVSLPCPFSWPVSTVNLKRCLLVSRVLVSGTDKELVLVNLHLEAYDDGDGKIEQTKQLRALLDEEAAKGNYVIAGGDFNQTFSSVDTGLYPAQEGKWQAGIINTEDFGSDFSMLMDPSTPTCRSLDQPYAGADKGSFQYYVIDGFIVSSNLRVESIETLDEGFLCADHNPVLMSVVIDG